MSLKHHTLSSLFSDIAKSIRIKTGDTLPIKADNFPYVIDNISTGGGENQYFIRVYELPNHTIELYWYSEIPKATKVSAGGMNEFQLSNTGTYTIKVKKDDALVWSKSVTISDYGVYIVKGRTKSEEEGGTPEERTISLSKEDLDIACQGGYAKYMFNIRDLWKPLTSGLFVDKPFYIQHFYDDGSIQFGLANSTWSTAYQINHVFRFYSSSTSPSTETINYSTAGGWKYSELRQQFMEKDDEVYMIAQSILPDGSSILSGTQFSELKYSKDKDGNSGTHANIYTYDEKNDVFTVEQTHWGTSKYPSLNYPYFVKGYWCIAKEGEVTEQNYMNYYIRTYKSTGNGACFIYTPPTSYDSSISYYGLYELIQTDGIFYSALSEIKDYLQDMELKQPSGPNQKTNGSVCYDKVTINSVGELFGLVYTGKQPDGTTNSTKQFGDPTNCHNDRFNGVKYLDMFHHYTSNTWTRSITGMYGICLGGQGTIGNAGPSGGFAIRPSFKFK